jgi:enediyne biosynthesis protein CalE5
MEAKSIDAGEFREGQRQQWNSAAGGWRRWSTVIDRGSGIVSQRLVEMAGIEPGDRVLDVACGYGEPALTAATRVGPEGRVVATDIAPEMMEFGRERAAEAGLDNLEFIESAASALSFPPESFDAALSRWGIIFEPDGEDAAGRIRGFLRPGARIAIASWATPDRVPMLSIPMQTVMRRLGIDPPPPGTPGPLSRPTPDAVSALLEGGGFSDVEVEEAEVEVEWESPDDFTVFIREIAPPVSAMMASHPPEVQEETWAAITEAVGKAASGDGAVRLTNVALLAAGSS